MLRNFTSPSSDTSFLHQGILPSGVFVPGAGDQARTSLEDLQHRFRILNSVAFACSHLGVSPDPIGVPTCDKQGGPGECDRRCPAQGQYN
jgi:hypothetical protein